MFTEFDYLSKQNKQQCQKAIKQKVMIGGMEWNRIARADQMMFSLLTACHNPIQ